MKVIGFDHLVLTVASIEATCTFYEAALGMTREIFGAERRTALRFGPHKINLHERGREFEPRAHVAMPGSADLCFLVDDLDGLAARLAGAGVPVLSGPVRRSGARGPIVSYYVRDPDLNLIELSQYQQAGDDA